MHNKLKAKSRKMGRSVLKSEETAKKTAAQRPDKSPPKSKPQGALWDKGKPPGGRNTVKARERRLEGKSL